jgi:hypothetical protein
MPPVSDMPAADPPIGGFFGLATAEGDGSLAAAWGLGDGLLAWENATSALAALIRHMAPGSVWLPGYLCRWTLDAVPLARRRFFGLGPDLAELAAGVRPGDLVLATNLFGRAPGAAWREFVGATDRVTFVEDCAQALETGQAPWGDWRLYSPRKLMGVPEGGLLVPVSRLAKAAGLPPPRLPPDPVKVAERRAPMQARRDRPSDPLGWQALHARAEHGYSVTDRAMDTPARLLLQSQSLRPMVLARQRNFAALAGPLAAFAFLPDTAPDFAPLGFPVVVPAARRDAVLARLHAARIFATVHWRDLAAPASLIGDHALAETMITLPCDHRYGPAEMARVADCFLEAAA